MRVRLRAVLVVAGAVLSVTVLMAEGARAQEAPSVTVTPSTGLQDGQTVLVEASGFTGTPLAPWAVAQCDASVVGATDAATVNASCIGANSVFISFGSSSFSTSLAVVVSGISFDGANLITCGEAPGDCVVLVGQVLIGGGDQGQPFENQGQCLRFVVARRS